jgi:hypothetical protein
MHAQLRHLVELSRQPNITIQVLPFGEGWHPATTGSFRILEFPEDVHSPVAFMETQAGDKLPTTCPAWLRCVTARTRTARL